MDAPQAKYIVKTIFDKRDNKRKSIIYSIIDIIDSNIYKEYLSNFFEFSTTFLEEKKGLLHLNFYKDNIPPYLINNIRTQRCHTIFKIFHILNKKYNNKYNLKMVDFVLSLTNENNWPIQFGIDLSNKGGRVKVYLSLQLGDNNLVLDKIESIAGSLKLNTKKILENFRYENFDAIGIDFLNNSDCKLKIYTFYHPRSGILKIKKIYRKYQQGGDKYFDFYFERIQKMPLKHIGILYRISKESLIDSVKVWTRFNKSTPLSILRPMLELKTVQLKRWLNSLGDIISSVKGRISYLTLENIKLGLYFR